MTCNVVLLHCGIATDIQSNPPPLAVSHYERKPVKCYITLSGFLPLSPCLSLPLSLSLFLCTIFQMSTTMSSANSPLTMTKSCKVCIHVQVQYLCEGQLEPWQFRVAFGQHSLLQEAISGVGPELEI